MVGDGMTRAPVVTFPTIRGSAEGEFNCRILYFVRNTTLESRIAPNKLSWLVHVSMTSAHPVPPDVTKHGERC